MVNQILLPDFLVNQSFTARKLQGVGKAPSNIALCKYWGKRCEVLNLPLTSSLSLSLGDKGAMTKITPLENLNEDEIYLNDVLVAHDLRFAKRLVNYLNVIRQQHKIFFKIETYLNIPMGAGVASSACGFAALALALNDLFQWQLTVPELSILARLGSGSAARSILSGFVEWQAGVRKDGLDSYGVPFDKTWPELRIGLLILNDQPKLLGSTDAMRITKDSSSLYKHWPEQVEGDLTTLKQAITDKDFEALGKVTENNALTMHALMMNAWPPICYYQPQTIEMMHKVWEARRNGIQVYFTQDAGPNLKLIFLNKDLNIIKILFSQAEIITPFPVN